MRVDDHEPAPKAHIRVGRLKRRAEFVRVGKGRRWHGVAMSIQAEHRVEPDESVARVGFTLTKKVGCSVVRNRARRRLREAVRLAPPDLPARSGHDYVIVGRIEALRMPFAELGAELARGLAAVHTRGKRRDKPRDAKPRDAKPPGPNEPERTRPQP